MYALLQRAKKIQITVYLDTSIDALSIYFCHNKNIRNLCLRKVQRITDLHGT